MRYLVAITALMALPALAQPLPPGPPSAEAGPDGPRRVMIQRMMTPPTQLSLTTEAETRLVPDQLQLAAGVVIDAPTAAEAMAGNAARMNAVIAALKAAGVAERDIQTSSLSVTPQYRYQPNQPPLRTGYQARNSVTLKTQKLGDAGKLLDALVKAGANEVSGPSFSVADPEAALDKARAAAVAKARARAQVYAAAAGMTVKRIVSISEPGSELPMPLPRPMMARMAAGAVESTPVEPGELTLSARVTMLFELADKQP